MNKGEDPRALAFITAAVCKILGGVGTEVTTGRYFCSFLIDAHSSAIGLRADKSNVIKYDGV